MIEDEEVEKAVDWLRTAAPEAAKARAERVYLEKYTKALMSIIMKEHATLSIGAQEREACSDMRYLTHLEGLRQAVEEEARIVFLREAAIAKQETWQTQSANGRAIKL